MTIAQLLTRARGFCCTPLRCERKVGKPFGTVLSQHSSRCVPLLYLLLQLSLAHAEPSMEVLFVWLLSQPRTRLQIPGACFCKYLVLVSQCCHCSAFCSHMRRAAYVGAAVLLQNRLHNALLSVLNLCALQAIFH
jgi:hypothetical protein